MSCGLRPPHRVRLGFFRVADRRRSKRTGLDKALYQVEEALRQVSQNSHSIDATRAVAELKALLQAKSPGQHRNSGGIADRKRRHVTASASADSQGQEESSSDTEDPAESPHSENSARQVVSPVSSRNPREESLAVDDAENPLQLLARASNLHLSPPSSDHAGSAPAGSGSLQSLLDHNTKDMAEIERFFNSTQFSLDTDADMDPISLGLLSEEEADALFAL